MDLALSLVTIAVGVAAIVMTAGAATPLVVGAFVVGSGAVAYGASNLYEAGHNIYVGSVGDGLTVATNPLRDTLFMGNDRLYHQIGGLFTTASAALIPIGQTKSVAKGLTEFTIGEVGGFIGGQASYHGTKLLGGSEQDAQRATLVGNILGGFAASSAARRFSLNELPTSKSFIDGMSPEDSQRYIQWHKYAKAGLSPVDRAKFQDWKFTPDIDLYLSNKHIYDNPDYFNQLDGSVIYPGTPESALGRIDGSVHNQGFLNGEYVDDIIDPGTLVDRYGNNNTGRYFSPAGASFGERALPPYMEKMPKKTYITIKPIPNKKGPVAPWFDQPGMGTQYFTDMEGGYLEKYGYLVEID
ncbi:TPA: TNT domain-containing protein [Streptococcus equi subsp. zooepidemicus]|nr:TNT domain-containing protein [Streptococcus equi subsp. zooepidemicus]HEL0652520.1 TNT domain-containing protein [Streptococcus equi subsp. zooepidemicus]HEL0694263.1 TNT domain-containing protein [Streptococcus equi subsp. zooepidemicus]HEL0759254.1 TNT domain-containing protein [Streptococcus equi subsp. zooepidemicus]HEL0772509.1 TNT domain-containing protein [Streptococcus equi subsp. zooepidemicus]